MQTINSKIVFSRTGSRASRGEWFIQLALVAVTVGALAWAVQWEMISAASVKKWLANWEWRDLKFFLIFFLPAFAGYGVQHLYRGAILTIDADGLRMETFKGSLWARKLIERKMLWSEIGQVSYLSAYGMLHIRPRRRSTPWAIRVNDWKLNEPFDGANDSIGRGKKKEADLIRIFREKGILDGYPSDSRMAVAQFDLMKHPGTRAMLIGLGGLILYSVVDGFLNHETWADFNLAYCLPHLIVAAIGIVAAACFLVFGKFDERIPSAIGVLLAIIFGAALGVASYIGGTRLNQWVGGPLVEETYHRDASCLNLIPENKSLPLIGYTDLAKKYWCSIDANEPVKVSVRKGLFGLYQVDLSKQTRAIRDYREMHR